MKNFFNSVANVFKTDPDKVDARGRSRLQQAIFDGNVKKVKSLLKAGADINLRADLMFPPLHLALVYDRHEISNVLIEAGADINLPNPDGRTPLHLAAKNSQEYLMNKMLKLGADATARDIAGRTPLHVLSTAQPEMMIALVKHDADVNAQDAMGDTPLHGFVADFHMLQLLFALKADPNIENNAGRTGFQQLLAKKSLLDDPDRVQLFIKNGANIDAVDDAGMPLLYIALKNREFDLFKMCFDQTDLSAQDNAGRNAVHWLVIREEFDLLRRALGRDPRLIKAVDQQGYTPLAQLIDTMGKEEGHSARREDMAEELIKAGADPDTVDDKNKTLVRYAVKYNRTHFLEFLHAKGAKLDVLDGNGYAPLHLALKKKNMTMLDMLLDLGADPDLTDARGWTVLDRLAEKGDRKSSFVQRLIVAGGQYVKQLPLNKEHIRNRKVGNDNHDHLNKEKPKSTGGIRRKKSSGGPSNPS